MHVPAWGMHAFIVASTVTLSCAAVAHQRTDDRAAFVRRLDQALLDRDARALARLSNIVASEQQLQLPWITERLLLPAGRLSRVRDLSEHQLLYSDGRGQMWRVSLIHDEARGWLARSRASLCGRPIVPRDDVPAMSATSWTILECWPPPR
jgi:hypothetical protein